MYIKIYNIGNQNPVELERFVQILEEHLGKKAVIQYMPMQAGDVVATYADVQDLMRDTGFAPSTSLEDGLRHFAKWYGEEYGSVRGVTNA